MTAATDRIGRSFRSLIRRLGDGQATLRRPVRLFNRITGEDTRSLELAAPLSGGETSISLRRSGSAALEGEIPAGTIITIDGEEYTAQADATTASDAITVTISPAISGAYSAGEAADVARWSEATYLYSQDEYSIGSIDGEMIRRGDSRWSMSDEAVGGVTPRAPREGDVSTTGRRIVEIRPTMGGWTAQVRVAG